MIELDVHTLTPTAISAANRQPDLTSTLRPANCAVPYGCVASNELAYVRPCLRRIPKALPPRENSRAGTENTATPRAKGRTGATVMLITNSNAIRIASVKPIASTGNPLVFSSNHTCARVADEVGHGSLNREINQSEIGRAHV